MFFIWGRCLPGDTEPTQRNRRIAWSVLALGFVIIAAAFAIPDRPHEGGNRFIKLALAFIGLYLMLMAVFRLVQIRERARALDGEDPLPTYAAIPSAPAANPSYPGAAAPPRVR